MVGDVGRVAELILLPPSRGDDPGLALVPVCVARVVHLASSCLWEGGWRTGASGSDGAVAPHEMARWPPRSARSIKGRVDLPDFATLVPRMSP
ncbi:hypothetical protein D3C86_1162040 [compost metagenome]